LMDGGGTEELFRRAKEYGAMTSADVTYDGRGAGFERIRGLLRYTDYFMPSYAEAKHLSGETDPGRMADFFIRETGDKTVVIKLGGDGCFLRSGGRSICVRPYAVDALDTTGAGDNFVAGFLTGLANGWETERCAEFANAVAGFSVQYLGATTDRMSMESVLDFMEHTPRK
jgi:sugar/nucleoside kinase (ribokinase family)